MADGVLSMAAPGIADLDVAVNTDGLRRPISMFGDAYRGIDQGDEVAAWLSRVLDADSRLVRVPPDHDRVTDGLTPGTSGFADSSAIHIVSTESLDDLNVRITANGGSALSMEHFRPNIVLRGGGNPYWEDQVRGMTFAESALGFTKLAVRCAVTLVDPGRGVKAGPEPLRTLAKYRRDPDGGVVFGAKFAVTAPGPISAADEYRVSEALPSQSAAQ